MTRERSKPHTFQQRISEAKSRFQLEASSLPAGAQRDQIEQKISQLDVADRMNSMLSGRSSKASN
jgi:hypothetical protein